MALIHELTRRLGSRAAVARQLGLNEDTLSNRIRGQSTTKREHILAAEALIGRINR